MRDSKQETGNIGKKMHNKNFHWITNAVASDLFSWLVPKNTTHLIQLISLERNCELT
jgi:hypothetical protein